VLGAIGGETATTCAQDCCDFVTPSAERIVHAGMRATVCRVTTDERVPTPQTVLISAHAAEQYQHRVKPALGLEEARAELEQLQPMGEITAVEPPWVNAAKPARYYLLVSDSVALPLAPQDGGWIATTCVTPTTYTPTRRAQRNADKASKASRKRAERRARF
jgi:hypothetical protein